MTQLAPPPPPPALVERGRLVGRLRRGIASTATLIAGPPGSGKTVLLASWFRERTTPAAWVSLEPADDDPVRFWTTFLSALRHCAAVADDAPLARLTAPRAPEERGFAARVVNAAAELDQPLAIVLDDVHLLRDGRVLDALGTLLMRAPPQLRLVLGSRSAPPLPLAALRVAGRLTEVHGDDLAFTRGEAVTLLAAHDVTLDDQQTRALMARTEGWAVALRLAAMALAAHPDPARLLADLTGDDRAVADYLLSEVLEREPPDRRAFLLRMSVLDEISTPLATAVAGPEAPRLLDDVRRSNGLVTPVDRRGRRHRCHGLLLELLRAQAAKEIGTELPELHGRAAAWYAADGQLVTAIRHGVLGARWPLVSDLVARHWMELYLRGEAALLAPDLAAIPPAALAADATLAAMAACSALDRGDARAGEAALATATDPAVPIRDADRERHADALALAGLLRARLRRDVAGAREAAADLAQRRSPAPLGLEPPGALVALNLAVLALGTPDLSGAARQLSGCVVRARASGQEYVLLGSLSHLALLEAQCGSIADAQPLAREALALARARGWADLPSAAPAHLALSLAHAETLALGAAKHRLCRGIRAAGTSSERSLRTAIAHVRATLALALGRQSDGLAAAQHLLAPEPPSLAGPHEQAVGALLRTKLLLAAGDLDAASSGLAALAPWADGPAELDVAAAHLALASGDAESALACLQDSAERDTRRVLADTRIELVVVEALACAALGQHAGRHAALERALATAESAGRWWPLLEGGERLRDLLREQSGESTVHGPLIDAVLDAWAGRRRAAPPSRQLAEPLSEREQTVLRYLASSRTNADIAAELFVTPNTVKTHVRSIYRKLGVGRRHDAVLRARELQLLSTPV